MSFESNAGKSTSGSLWDLHSCIITMISYGSKFPHVLSNTIFLKTTKRTLTDLPQFKETSFNKEGTNIIKNLCWNAYVENDVTSRDAAHN